MELSQKLAEQRSLPLRCIENPKLLRPGVRRKQPSVPRTHPPTEERVAALMEIAQEPASISLPMKSSLPNATFRRLIDLESEENFDTISSAGFGNSTRIEIIKQLNLTVGSVSDECVQGEAASR